MMELVVRKLRKRNGGLGTSRLCLSDGFSTASKTNQTHGWILSYILAAFGIGRTRDSHPVAFVNIDDNPKTGEGMKTGCWKKVPPTPEPTESSAI